ncbi:MAG TPA: tail fiber assembly protein [Buttiauxella sp.]|jgi:hypothetical protein
MIFFDTVKNENIFISIAEDIEPFLAGASIDADGQTYYEFQKKITTKYTCVIDARSGRVRHITEDASSIAPGVGERVIGIKKIPDKYFESLPSDWQFDGTKIIAYQKSKEELIAVANTIKTKLMDVANAAIAPLQDAVDLGIANDDEAALLLEWKKYRVFLNRTDTTTAPVTGWPVPPVT